MKRMYALKRFFKPSWKKVALTVAGYAIARALAKPLVLLLLAFGDGGYVVPTKIFIALIRVIVPGYWLAEQVVAFGALYFVLRIVFQASYIYLIVCTALFFFKKENHQQ